METRRSASADYRRGSVYSLLTTFLLATQEPFSFLAAKHLTTLQFVCLTQVALLVSIPIVTARGGAFRDFVAIFRQPSNYGKLAIVFAIGVCGLLLYNFGLSEAHPIIVSAILNLSPFWAALAALLLARVPVPVSPKVFFTCFAASFIGAMMVAWSQAGEALEPTKGELAESLASEVTESFLRGGWLYILPVPVCSVLSGTLIARWFSQYRESAAVAANFFVSNVVLIPATAVLLYRRSELVPDTQLLAVGLMLVGTILAGSIGRIVYQISLTITGGDNGFVTMFWSLTPALTALISFAMSLWIPALRFIANPMFFAGVALIAVSLTIFSLRSWRQPRRSGHADK